MLVGSAKRTGVELVSAVLGAPSESERDAATMSLLDYGFSLYHRRTPVQRGRGAARRSRSTTATLKVPLAPTADLRLTVRKGQDVETAVRAPDEVDGPGEPRASAWARSSVSVDGEAVARAPLAATRAAAAASLLERYDAAIPGPRRWPGGSRSSRSGAGLRSAPIAIWDRRR